MPRHARHKRKRGVSKKRQSSEDAPAKEKKMFQNELELHCSCCFCSYSNAPCHHTSSQCCSPPSSASASAQASAFARAPMARTPSTTFIATHKREGREGQTKTVTGNGRSTNQEDTVGFSYTYNSNLNPVDFDFDFDNIARGVSLQAAVPCLAPAAGPPPRPP